MATKLAGTKRRSYTVSDKLRIINFAEQHGNLAAEREFGVSESNVRLWRKSKENLEKMPRLKRANRGKKAAWPELEVDLLEWITEKRNNGLAILPSLVRLKALDMAKNEKYGIPQGQFKAGNHWCQRFMKRNGLSLRQKTTLAQRLPDDYEEKIVRFHRYIIDLRKEHNYPLHVIANMDETPLTFDMPPNRTINNSGEKTIKIRTTGNEKNRITVVLTCAGDGSKLRPMVIFKRKTLPKVANKHGVVIAAQEKGWMDGEGMKTWIDKVWCSRRGGLGRRRSLLVCDAFEAHVTERVKTALTRENTNLAVIPGGLTSILQPLDVSLNKPFKDGVRKRWMEWMAEGIHEFTASGRQKKPSEELILSWIAGAWQDISEEMIESSFLKCGITNSLDGSEDDLVYEANDDCDNELDDSFARELFQSDSESEFEGFDSGQSKSSASGSASVQEVSRADSHLEERRTLSHTSSTTQRSLQQSISPQVQSRTEEQNSGTLTDQSSSFESSVSTSARRHRAVAHKEVRFRDELTSSKEIQQRDHCVATDSEFIQETSAFRAAMNYDDDDDNASDNTEEQKEYYYNHTDKMNYAQNRRVIPLQNQDELGRETVHNYEPSVKSKSSSKQQETSHRHSDEGFPLPHKNRTEQRFNVEKFSDSGTSRRLDYQENGPATEGFMTSTPHKKFDPVFSSPKALQAGKVEAQKEAQRIMLKLQENERKLNRSIQEVRDVEFELEEAASRKKIALQELQVLEETITRNKAEVNSSENLVEQYRQQATKTRSQLMDLELQRDNIQHEIKELRNCLAKQKQESKQVVEVEKRNELKILELTIERDQIQSEVESLRSQLNHAEGNFAQEKQKFVEKLIFAQDQLQQEQRASKESVGKLKQQLEDERQKARDSHYERINAIHKLQDESKEMHEKEIEVLKNRFVREKEMELETLREKTRRDTEGLNKKLQEQDHSISHLQSSLKEYEEEITKLKTQVFQEQQKLFDCESEWKENLAKQNTHAKSLRIEIDSLNENEACLHEKIRRTEQLLEEKILELKRHEEKSSSLSEELKQVMKNKDDEITMLRGLVRQQEDATRLLGEKMRNEAQEHIRNALEKERESTDRERARHQAKLEEIRDKYESALKQVREELEAERQGHHHLSASVNKIKKEIERLRELNLQAEQEKVNAVAHVRSEAKEEIVKMRNKIQELTALAETSEKETAMELTEECRKTAALLGDSANTTPVRNLSSSYVGESPRSTTDSPAQEALLNLRSYNEELRQHLIEARKELEQNNRELSLKKQFQQPGSGDPLTPQQVHLFKKTLIAKDEEIARAKRQLQEESERNALQIKSERTAYQKTIDRLEKELKQAKAATPAGSPMVNGTSSPPESGVGTSLSSTTPSPRPGEDSSTARLLRHLQGRVQQLRAQNDSLRKSSENESLNDSHCSVMSTESFNGGETEETKRLHAALKTTEDKAQRNAAMLSQKMMEMTKLQKMLTHATKENMKLERAYAALQRKIIDNSR